MFDLQWLQSLLGQGLPPGYATNNDQALPVSGLLGQQPMPDVTNPGMAVTSPLVDFNQDPSQMVTQGGLFPSMPDVDLTAVDDPAKLAQMAGLFSEDEQQPMLPSAGLFRSNPYQAVPWSYMQNRRKARI